MDDINAGEPFLPFPGSVLPALLALRRTHQTIQESKAYLDARTVETDAERKQLENDRASLRDQRALTDALTARVDALKRQLRAKADTAPEDGAREKMEGLQARRKQYNSERRRLTRALIDFIDSQLAGMLAAEELGGPVVGDVVDIHSDDLVDGLDSQGRLKRKDSGVDGKRQQRIDELWGQKNRSGTVRHVSGRDELAAAAQEMRELTEALLLRLEDAMGDNSASYVTLERESAAARFLVRSKVAQFHPRDANRLRLIDFGRDLDN